MQANISNAKLKNCKTAYFSSIDTPTLSINYICVHHVINSISAGHVTGIIHSRIKQMMATIPICNTMTNHRLIVLSFEYVIHMESGLHLSAFITSPYKYF